MTRLRIYKKRGSEIGNPPSLMPGGHVEFEVQEFIEHCNDLDNMRWYSARSSDGHVQWLTETDASNWQDKVKEYFATVLISAE